MLGLVAGLGACALSPQVVSLDPGIQAPADAGRGAGRRLALRVIDARADPVAGRRGGVYDTATITTSPELTATLAASLREAFGSAGFQLIEAGGRAAIDLQVYLEELSYRVEEGDLVRTVTTRAVLRAVSRMQDTEMKVIYRESVDKDVLTAPSRAANVELLESVLSKALSRLAGDRRLTDPEA